MHHYLRRISRVAFAIALTGPTAAPVQAQTASASLLSLPVTQSSAPASDDGVRRLSLDEAVRLAMEQNLGIRIQRFDPQIQDVGIAQARSFWAPNLVSSFARQSQTQFSTTALAGGATVDNGNLSTRVGLDQTLPWGGSYTTSWNNSRFTTTSLFASFSPQLQSTLSVNYSQPLLRNLRIDQIRQQVAISGKGREFSDIQLQAVILQTMRNVKNAYWDLSYAINNLAAQRQSLELAERSLRDNQRRVEIGTMAPIDIVQAQAEVASNQQNVIVAEAAIKQAEDRLRILIFDPAMPSFWNIGLEPTDTAPFEVQAIDVEAAIRHALEKRSDLAQAKNSLQQSDINIRYFRNQILPDISANVNYISTGTGGVELSPVNGFAVPPGTVPVRSIVAERRFSSALNDVIQNAYPNWTVGVSVGYPLGLSTSEANLARAKLQYQQAQTQIRNLELQVMTQVRELARQVQTNQQRVKSARASRELQEKKLEAEEKKQAAGMSTTFLVFQAQRDLAQSRTQEILAISDYNKSLVDFEAVQEIPLTAGQGGTGSGSGGLGAGGTGGVVTAGSGAIQTGGATIIRQ